MVDLAWRLGHRARRIIERMSTLLNRLVRAAVALAVPLVLAGTVTVVLGWDWLKRHWSTPSLSTVSDRSGFWRHSLPAILWF